MDRSEVKDIVLLVKVDTPERNESEKQIELEQDIKFYIQPPTSDFNILVLKPG